MVNNPPWMILLLCAAGYLLGSVPFGVLVTHALGLTDPRSAGSGNIGSTNVLRVGGKLAGALTLFGDIGKGWLAAWGAGWWLGGESAVLLVALCAVLGHLFPVFLRFKGGKGVATALGAIAGVAPWLGIAVSLIWLASLALWRYSSGAALVAFAAFPILSIWLRPRPVFLAFACAVTALIVLRHHANITRLLSGTEPKVGASSASAQTES